MARREPCQILSSLRSFFYKKSQQINKNTIKFYSNVAFQLPKKRNAQLDRIFITGLRRW